MESFATTAVLLLTVSSFVYTENNINGIQTDRHRRSTNSRLSDVTASPCDDYNPPKPNFERLGQRKADVKCYEFIWQMKYRSDKTARLTKCREYLKQNGTLPWLRNLVIGGHGTIPGEYPHMGAIGWKATTGTWIFKCGGSLISEKFVLTAGHCTRASSRDSSIADVIPKIIRLGDKNILDIFSNYHAPTDAKISRIIPHAKYAPPKKYFDIALMELETSVTFSKFVQPACLWTKSNLHGLNSVTITGWGVVESGSRTTSTELQAGHVDLVDPRQCNLTLQPTCNRNWCGLQGHQLCAGKMEGGVDSCQGDSGGPLQVKLPVPIKDEGNMNTVVGVTSFGIGCAMPNMPGIYTKVSYFLDWIESVVWP